MKGKHPAEDELREFYIGQECRNCLCLRCARDNWVGDDDLRPAGYQPCCEQHHDLGNVDIANGAECAILDCPDFEPEMEDEA